MGLLISEFKLICSSHSHYARLHPQATSRSPLYHARRHAVVAVSLVANSGNTRNNPTVIPVPAVAKRYGRKLHAATAGRSVATFGIDL